MSEEKQGQLYQKLTAYYQDYAKDPDSTQNFIAGIHDGTKRAKQFLDEAKADFPSEDTDDSTGRETGVYKAREIDRWFEKWFGEP